MTKNKLVSVAPPLGMPIGKLLKAAKKGQVVEFTIKVIRCEVIKPYPVTPEEERQQRAKLKKKKNVNIKKQKGAR
jgi:hypothetical protein